MLLLGLLPQIIAACRHSVPGDAVVLHEMTPALQLVALRDRRIDLSFSRTAVNHTGYGCIDIDDIVMGGRHLEALGDTRSWGVGRPASTGPPPVRSALRPPTERTIGKTAYPVAFGCAARFSAAP